MSDQSVKESVYKRGIFSGLSPNVIKLGFVSFFADISSEMLYPLTPIFLSTVLSAPVAALGFIEGAAEATASILKTVSGRLSDISGKRKPYVFAGYAVSALVKPLIGLATIWPTVLVARVGDRFGKGLRTSPRDALLADFVSPEVRGKAFGVHRGMDTLGAVFGPLLALLLVYLTRNDLRLIFILAAIPGFIGALLVLTVPDRPRPSGNPSQVGSIHFRALPPAFRAYLIAWAVFSFANSSDIFLILRANHLEYTITPNLARATVYTVLLYTFYNLVYAAASPGLGKLSDRIGRRKVLVGGLVVFALVYLGFAGVNASWQLWPLFAIYGLYTAATDGVGKAFAVDLVPSGIRASAIGLLGTVTGFATLAASSMAGLLWDALGPWAAFAYGSTGAVLGALLMLRVAAGK